MNEPRTIHPHSGGGAVMMVSATSSEGSASVSHVSS